MEKGMKYDVNIDLANETKKAMADALETNNKRVLNKIGAFSSLYDIVTFGFLVVLIINKNNPKITIVPPSHCDGVTTSPNI